MAETGHLPIRHTLEVVSLLLQVDARVAQEALEHDCLSAAGVLQDVEAWKKKEVRYNTKHNYTINKSVALCMLEASEASQQGALDRIHLNLLTHR